MGFRFVSSKLGTEWVTAMCKRAVGGLEPDSTMEALQNEADRVKGPWSPQEDQALQCLVKRYGARNWSLISRWSTDHSRRRRTGESLKPTQSTEISGRRSRGCSMARQSSGGGPSMPATGLCLSPGSPTGSDVSDTGFPVVSSPNLYRPVARTGAVQVPPQQFEPSSKKDDPPTALTLSLPGTETYENEYESPPLDSAPRHNKLASPEKQPALTFAMPENPEPMTFGSDFFLMIQDMIKTEVKNYMSGLEINEICSQKSYLLTRTAFFLLFKQLFTQLITTYKTILLSFIFPNF
ncbi:unnamed protein product, partial [Vitis vinifera]